MPPFDALAVEPRSVAAARIDQVVDAGLAPNLGVSARSIEVRMSIEGDIALRHPAEPNDVPVELADPARMCAKGLMESDHREKEIARLARPSNGIPGAAL
jgi:hypothetical protein